MSCRARNKHRRNRYRQSEDVNPMNYVSNLSDVMLILAVGIMLALILHWNVKIEDTQTTVPEESQSEAISFSEDDLSDSEELPENMERMGEVYYDAETGRYYVVENEAG